MDKKQAQQIEQDKLLIDSLGGPTKLAAKIGLTNPGGPQRVYNWTQRGIPARVKLEHPELFLRSMRVRGQGRRA